MRSQLRRPNPRNIFPAGAAKAMDAPQPVVQPVAVARWVQRALPVQASLKVNAPGDRYEQQAERVADQVMRAPSVSLPTVDATVQRQTCSCGRPAGPDGLCDECRRKQAGQEPEAIQRMEGSVDAGAAQSAAPPVVQQALAQPGRPLDGPTRSFMESRFGRDFGRVRVHTGEPAAASAKAINARAYTRGGNIVFNAGQYRPHTAGGRRLLAHELTHVVQQQGGGSPAAIQRDENEPKKGQGPAAAPPAGAAPTPAQKTDVALLLDDSTDAANEARTYSSTVIRAFNSEDAANKLKALGQPIGVLYVVSHSNAAGQVEVKSSIGTISWQSLADFSQSLKGALPAGSAPDVVDFRGCKLGNAPGQMEAFRKNVGASEARATDCWSISTNATPLTAPDGSEITSPGQIPAGMGKAFDKALRKQINNMQSEDGTKVKNCITGLAPGEKADKSFAKIKRIYFQNGGILSAGWASPEFNQSWQAGSICAKDMTASTSPCKLVIKR